MQPLNKHVGLRGWRQTERGGRGDCSSERRGKTLIADKYALKKKRKKKSAA